MFAKSSQSISLPTLVRDRGSEAGMKGFSGSRTRRMHRRLGFTAEKHTLSVVILVSLLFGSSLEATDFNRYEPISLPLTTSTPDDSKVEGILAGGRAVASSIPNAVTVQPPPIRWDSNEFGSLIQHSFVPFQEIGHLDTSPLIGTSSPTPRTEAPAGGDGYLPVVNYPNAAHYFPVAQSPEICGPVAVPFEPGDFLGTPVPAIPYQPPSTFKPTSVSHSCRRNDRGWNGGDLFTPVACMHRPYRFSPMSTRSRRISSSPVIIEQELVCIATMDSPFVP